MFAVPACSLLSGSRRDPFAVSLTTLRDLCQSRISFAPFRPILEQKSAEPRESCQASQNEHLQKSSDNSREMNTYIKKERGEAYHLVWANRRRRYNSFAFILLCDPRKELPRNQILTKKGGGVWGAAGPRL